MKNLIILLLFVTSHAFSQTGKYAFVFLHKKLDAEKLTKEQSDKIMEGHMANINRLASEKKLLAAGPFEGGGGLFILNTTSVEEATSWLSTDPGVQAKRWNIEILPYTPNIGSVCSVTAPYKMTMYKFIRFTPDIQKFNVQNYPDLLAKHNDYLKQSIPKDSVVTQASFGDRDGGIIVFKSGIKQEVFEADPAVTGGFLVIEMKELWIAKGSFCEK